MQNPFVEHLMGTVSVTVQKFRDTVSVSTVVFFRTPSRSRQYRGGALLPVLSFLSLRRTIAWKLAGVGDEQEEVRHPVSDSSGGFAAARERRSMDGAVQRRPSHRRSPRGPPLPRARCHPSSWTARRRARSLPPPCPYGRPVEDRRITPSPTEV